MRNRTLTKRRKILIIGICLVLLLPVIGMLISDEVDWSSFDFLIAAVLLSTFGFLIDFISSKIQSRRLKGLALACLIILLILIWGELAVGLFGTPWAGN